MKKIKWFYLVEREEFNKLYFNKDYYIELLFCWYKERSFEKEGIDYIWYNSYKQVEGKKINCFEKIPHKYYIYV